LLVPLADAFLQVGTWVALTLAAFGLFEMRTGDGLVRMLERPDRGVLFGSLLGIVPGAAPPSSSCRCTSPDGSATGRLWRPFVAV